MESAFSITAALHSEGVLSQLDVVPGNEDWLILLDGVEIGTLANNGDDKWYWKDSGIDEDSATRVGQALEDHYM